MRQNIVLEDRLIDLRISLELLYLGDKGGELRFRLALTGAWHLAGSQEERRRIFIELRDFYDLASSVIHGGRVRNENDAAERLTAIQRLCRMGIQKFLKETRPSDLTELVFGDD